MGEDACARNIVTLANFDPTSLVSTPIDAFDSESLPLQFFDGLEGPEINEMRYAKSMY